MVGRHDHMSMMIERQMWSFMGRYRLADCLVGEAVAMHVQTMSQIKLKFDAWQAATDVVAAVCLVDDFLASMDEVTGRYVTPAIRSACTDRIDGCGWLPMASLVLKRRLARCSSVVFLVSAMLTGCFGSGSQHRL